mmetsp:Transcript_3698/g.8439  ORF Transcript_3698/g.8439 Transcript_3698/m.8439 type:complete len:98 (+) Transcript_3698:145-438(+)
MPLTTNITRQTPTTNREETYETDTNRQCGHHVNMVGRVSCTPSRPRKTQLPACLGWLVRQTHPTDDIPTDRQTGRSKNSSTAAKQSRKNVCADYALG